MTQVVAFLFDRLPGHPARTRLAKSISELVMEEWDLYDKHRIKTGKTVTKGQEFGLNEYRLVVHVCLLNSRNQMLIQQRQHFKEGWPGMWDLTVGGSACKGESSQLAAQRELHEEIGYFVDLSAVRPAFTVNFERGFNDYYIINAAPDLSALRLQASEVKAVKWASKEEILKLIEQDHFIPYHRSVIEMIFDMNTRQGAHVN